MVNNVHYDRKKKGSLGLSLERPVGSLHLKSGLRLEPSWDLQDTSAILEKPRAYKDGRLKKPIKLVLWDRSEETYARHRNPLFDADDDRIRLGLTILALGIDAMHTIYLGLAKYIVLLILWRFLDENIFEVHQSTLDEKRKLGIRRLTSELFNWYGQRAKQFRQEKFSHLNDLKLSMLGKGDTDELKTKAAETYGLLLFCLDICLEYAHKIKHADDLYKCGSELLKVLTIMKTAGYRFTDEEKKDCEILRWVYRIPLPSLFLYFPYTTKRPKITKLNLDIIQI